MAVWWVLLTPPVQNLHISIFGVIPKKGQLGKWRLIVDLASPQGHGVSDGIDPDFWHLQYIKIDDIIKTVSNFGMVLSWPNLT